MQNNRSISLFEESLGYSFKDRSLLVQALSHRSFALHKQTADNERLEFLGDAVLQLIVSSHLYINNPTLSVGGLTKTRAALVCQRALATMAKKINLSGYILLGENDGVSSTLRRRSSLLSDTLEAVFGAIYLDSDLETVSEIIIRLLPTWEEETVVQADSKTALQEYLQGISKERPRYYMAGQEGPAHDRRFTMEVWHGTRLLARGRGKSKKTAAQLAAKQALRRLGVRE